MFSGALVAMGVAQVREAIARRHRAWSRHRATQTLLLNGYLTGGPAGRVDAQTLEALEILKAQGCVIVMEDKLRRDQPSHQWGAASDQDASAKAIRLVTREGTRV